MSTEQSKVYDIVVIGGGTGGYVAAIRAVQHGRKVVIVERQLLGGTCLHRGCIPTKTLLESSKLYDRIKQATLFGIELDGADVQFHVGKVFDRKTHIVDQLHQGIQFLMKKNKIDVVYGHGRIQRKTDQRFNIQIEGSSQAHPQTILATHVILATGSSPIVPADVHIDGQKLFTSDEILANPLQPKHITIIGAGAIGVEFACYFRELGSEVRLVEWSEHIVPLEDRDISDELKRILERKGIEILTDCSLLTDSIHYADGDLTAYTIQHHQGETYTCYSDILLFAIGRKNHISELGLTNVGIEADRFIPTNGHMETAVDGLYAIGDITGSYQLAHVASQQAIIAVDAICKQEIIPYEPSRVPRCTYTHPEIASVGMTEEQAEQAGLSYKIGKFPLKSHGRSLIQGEVEGFIKLVVDAGTDGLLGAHMIGHGATELISLPSFAMFMEGTAWELSMNVYPHPTVAEIFGEAAHAVGGHAIHR